MRPGSPGRITDPEAAPVVSVDQHLPAVPAPALTPEALRRRFASPPPWKPEFRGDGSVFSNEAPRAAAVLVPLVLHANGPTVLLTRRTDHLRQHAGQISFPGGRHEPGDADAVATALREAQEEVGLDAAGVEVLGHLPDYHTVTRYEVTPVVALLQPSYRLQLDEREVAEAFEVPLSFLMNPAHHRRHQVQVQGVRRHFLSMPWEGPGPGGPPRRYFIWGATAAMLRNFYRFLSA